MQPKYISLLLLLLLKFASCQELPRPMISRPNGCTSYRNESDCIYYVNCVGYIENNLQSYVVQSRIYDSYPRRTYDRDNSCTDYISLNRGNYAKIYLKFQNSDSINSDTAIPPVDGRNVYHYRDPGMDQVHQLIVNLDASDNAYTVFPNFEKMDNLVFLNLSSNLLSVAKLSNPSPLPLLTTIDLSYNTISSIEVKDLEKTYKKLTHLNLSHNYMVEITDSVFHDFELLEVLDLSYNYIDTMSITTFDGIRKLYGLFLSHNRLSEINQAFFRFNKLIAIDLSFNRIERIKKTDFERLVSLNVIDLSFNSILSIDPCAFCNLDFLTSINLHNNKLHSLNQDTFLNASSLITVDISFNQVNILPRGLFRSNHLQNFYVKGNILKGTLTKGTFDGFDQVTEVDLSYQQLTTLEDYAFLGLESVNTLLLSNNKINVLGNNCFRMLKKLSTLDLSSNNITELSFNKEDLVNLSTIVLRNNFLTHINPDNFRGLNVLKFLDLTNNSISKFESNAFSSLRDLVNFEISNNPLTGILQEKTFDGLNSLPILIISFTHLVAIENSTFLEMSQLKELNLSHNQIAELQYNAFAQTGAIESLDLSFNQLSTFNVNASTLANIGILLLNNNLLKIVTETYFIGLSRLTKVDLAYNDIHSVHLEAFNNQTDLRFLDLSYNPRINFDISFISKHQTLYNLCLSGLNNYITFSKIKDTQLSTLEYSHSGITNVTVISLKKLTRLEKIVLSYNNISEVTVGAFKNLTQLGQLDISNNIIKYIQPGVFKDNVRLDFLNISHNHLTSIPYGIFRGLIYLSKLDMSYNNINSLETGRFFEVQKLTTLIVDHNKISSFNADEFIGTQLSTLSIGDNPLSCELLVNLKKEPVTFTITAVVLDEHIGENIDGVTCNMNGNVFERKYYNANSSFDEKILVDLKEVLAKIANKNADATLTDLANENFKYLKNMTDNNIQVSHKIESSWSILANSTLLMTAQTNSTNILLGKILNALNRKSLTSTTPIPLPKDNSTKNLVLYINQLKEELENTIAAEKENILNEVEKKITNYNSSFHSSNVAIKEKSVTKDETSNNVESNKFTEICVGIILAILICLVLYKFYKSKMFVRTRRSYSTRELPGSMESPDL